MSRKIEITQTQADQFNRMLDTLKRIGGNGKSTTYMTPDQIRKHSQWGDPDEEISMAYENIQSEARNVSKNVRQIDTKQLRIYE
jgi:hypothetical protein